MNTVRFGLKNVVYSIPTYDGSTITYAAVKSVPGAVTLTLEAEGDITEFFADDVLYFADSNNSGYSGSLEFARITDDMLKDIWQQLEDNVGAIFEYENVKSVDVAIGFEIDGDDRGRKIWLYRVACKRPNENSASKAGANEPQTVSFDIRAFGRQTDQLVRSKIEPDGTNDTEFNAWLDAPQEFTPVP